MYRKIVSTFIVLFCFAAPLVYADAIEISGNITANTTWLKSNTYLLKGFVYVKSGATLTIEPGTIIFGEPSAAATR